MTGATAANQTTLIVVALIGAVGSVVAAVVTGFFAFLMLRVKKVTEATHSIINHDREVTLEAQAQTLRVAALDHPSDASLQAAALRAEAAAEGARQGNALPRSKLK